MSLSVYAVDECIQQEAGQSIAMIALFHMYHNFGRVHQTLRVTPAMEAGLSQYVSTIQEIVCLAESCAILAA